MIKKVITASAFALASVAAINAQTPEFNGVIGNTLKDSKEYWP